MKKIILGLLLITATNLQAQIPMWALHPTYDMIKPLNNGNFVVTKNGKQGILDAQESQIVPIKYDKIDFFIGNMGLIYNDNKLIAYTNDNGEMKDVSNMDYKTVCLDRFSDGYLAVSNQSGYYFLKDNGDTPLGPYTFVYPFSEGYAWVKVPKSAKHVTDGGYTFDVLSAETGQPVYLALGEYDKSDIDFISTSSNGKCIIVLKKQFFEYDYKAETLTPLSTDNNPGNKKTRVTANERPVKVNVEGDRFSIQAKQGYFTFDPMMRLTGITYTGQPTQYFEVPQPPVVTMESPIAPVGYNDTKLLGLNYLGKEVLSAQFDEVDRRWDDNVLVKQNGKYGVITFDPKHTCKFVLNEKMNIGFEHKSVVTNIKVTCPPYMKLPLMTLSSLDKNCTINIDTRKENTNIETAVLSYNCTLEMPEEVGLEQTRSAVRFSINYDGLKFTPASIPFTAWYINNYTVELLSHQQNGSVLTAEFLVRNTGQHDGINYFRDVSIETDDSTNCEFTKVTEEMYSARLSGFQESTVNFSVDITEDGCPTITYPFSINVKGNTASSAKGKGKDKGTDATEQKQEVVQSKASVKHKSVKQNKPKPAPKKEEKKIILK